LLAIDREMLVRRELNVDTNGCVNSCNDILKLWDPAAAGSRPTSTDESSTNRTAEARDLLLQGNGASLINNLPKTFFNANIKPD
jgi:hypothetical protein